MEYITVRQSWNGALQKSHKRINYDASSNTNAQYEKNLSSGENAPCARIMRDRVNAITKEYNVQGVPSYDHCKSIPSLIKIWQ